MMPVLSRRRPSMNLRRKAGSTKNSSMDSGDFHALLQQSKQPDLSIPLPTYTTFEKAPQFTLSSTALNLPDTYQSSEEASSPTSHSPAEYLDSDDLSEGASSYVSVDSDFDFGLDLEEDEEFSGSEHEAEISTISKGTQIAIAVSFQIVGPARVVTIADLAPIAKRQTNPRLNSSSSFTLHTAQAVSAKSSSFAQKRLSFHHEGPVIASTPVVMDIPRRGRSPRGPSPLSSSVDSNSSNHSGSDVDASICTSRASSIYEENDSEAETEVEMEQTELVPVPYAPYFGDFDMNPPPPTPTSWAQYDPYSLEPPRLASRPKIQQRLSTRLESRPMGYSVSVASQESPAKEKESRWAGFGLGKGRKAMCKAGRRG